MVPSVGRQDGIVFYVYADDHNPPHLHAFYAEHEVLLVIETGAVYAGSLPRPQQAVAQAWLAQPENHEAVLAHWLRLNP